MSAYKLKLMVLASFLLIFGSAIRVVADGHSCISGSPGWQCPSDERIAALPLETRENNVFFPRGGANLDQDARDQVMQLAKVLQTQLMSGTCIRLEGHSDSVGGNAVNQNLSMRRAMSVRDALAAAMGALAVPIEVSGMGEDNHLGIIPSDHVGQRRVTIWARSCV